MRTRVIVGLLLASTVLAGGARGAQPAIESPPSDATPAPKPQSSVAFAHRAAVEDLFQIKAAQLAQKRSSNTVVKSFAARLIQDHTGSTDNLLDALKQAHLPAPESIPTVLDTPHRDQLKQLEDGPAQSFDRRYMQQQIATDQETLSLLQGYTADGDNGALKNYANSTIPTVENHLAMAHKIVNSGYKKM